MARYSTWIHDHQLCAVALEYTSEGFGNAGPDDVATGIGLIALDEWFDPLKEYTLRAKEDEPERTRKVSPLLIEFSHHRNPGAQKNPLAMDHHSAVEMVENWFSSLNLKRGKKLVLVGYNLPTTRMLLIDMLGYAIYQSIFWDEFSIDLATLAVAFLERSEKRGEPLMMRLDRGLTGVATHLGVNEYKRGDLLMQCLATAGVARRFLGMPRL